MNRRTAGALLVLCVMCGAAVAQPSRDTSFTIFSAARSIAAEHPEAVLVLPSHPANVTSVMNIPCASCGDRVLHLDLFRPADSLRHPGFLLIHGGGWRSGDRSQQIPMVERIASRGYVCAAVEYRLSGEARYPAAVHDVKAAVRWMRMHGSEYGVDTSAIAVGGCSAGGQLAALVGATNGIVRFEGEGGNRAQSSVVQAVVDIDGILDFSDPAESGKDTIPGKPSAGTLWFGGTFREKPETWLDASPLTHAGPKSPPILFVNSALERFHAGRDSMISILSRSGTWTVVRTLPKTPHPFGSSIPGSNRHVTPWSRSWTGCSRANAADLLRSHTPLEHARCRRGSR